MGNVNIKGSPAIVWGTGNVMNSATANAFAGAVVESLSITPKNAEPIEIEGNDGTACNEIILLDGFNAKANVLYDSSKVWPIEGANATLALPYSAGANTALFGAGTGNGVTIANGVATYTVLVASVAPGLKRKGEATLDISLTYRPNVAV